MVINEKFGPVLWKESPEIEFIFQSSLDGNSWHIQQQYHRMKYVCITYSSVNMTNFNSEKVQYLILIYFMKIKKKKSRTRLSDNCFDLINYKFNLMLKKKCYCEYWVLYREKILKHSMAFLCHKPSHPSSPHPFPPLPTTLFPFLLVLPYLAFFPCISLLSSPEQF